MPLAPWLRILLAVGGFTILVVVLDAAIRTFLLPRAASVRLTRAVSKAVGRPFLLLAGPRRTMARRDQVLSLYPSVLLFSLQAVWLALTVVGFAALFVGIGGTTVGDGFEVSGSSLFTLGTTPVRGAGQQTLAFSEAGIGLTLLALLIAFIPSLYSAFQRRELEVSRLAVRAGTPATPWGMLEIAKSIGDFSRLEEVWADWEVWFIDVAETHTTHSILNFYRSRSAGKSWIASAATVLDAAALYNAAVDLEPSVGAALCIRSGWLALRELADVFSLPYPTEPTRADPIATTRAEFDLVLDHLEASGVPLIADRAQAWGDFVGWRVNYDAAIEQLTSFLSYERLDWSSVVNRPLLPPTNQRGQR